MTYILDVAIRNEAPHGQIFRAIEAVNAEKPNGHRIVFSVTVSHVDTPCRALLFLEPEASPADTEVLLERLGEWTYDGMLRTTHLTREQLAA